MQRISFTVFLALLSALSTSAKSTTQLDNGDFLTVVDATAGGAFTTEPHGFAYFSFARQDVIALTDAEAAQSAEWHIAFKRSEIRLNGGISGPGQGGAFPAYQTDQTFADIAEAVQFRYFADKASSAFSSDTGEWYSYDSTTHILSTRNHVYVIDTGAGFYKMQILNYYREVAGAPVSGFITFRWRPLAGAPGTAIRASSWGQLKAHLWDSN